MVEYEKTLSLFDSLIEWGIICLIFFTPIAFSTVEVWSESVMEIGIFFVSFIWFLKIYLQGKISIVDNPINLVIISFICLVAFQLIPFPDFLINIISPSTKKILDLYTTGISETFKFKTISLNPWATKGEFVKLLTYAMVYFLVANNFNGKGRKIRLILSIIIVGCIESFYGIIQYVSGEKMIFEFSKMFHATDRLISTFPSADHFSAYIKMCIFISVGYLIYFSEKGNNNKNYKFDGVRRKRNKRGTDSFIINKIFMFSERDLEKKIILVFTIVIMTIALIFTKSRGGILSFIVSFVFMFMLILFRGALKGHLWILILVIAITLVFGCWIGFVPVFDRYFNVSIKEELEEGRFSIWSSTYNIFRDYPVLGTGFGSFQYIFPLYSLRSNQGWVNHAHNDWLELLSDTGVLGFTIILLGTVYLAIFTLKEVLFYKNDSQIWIFFGAYTAILSIIIHSFIDFNLRTDANPFLVSVILGLLVSLLNTSIPVMRNKR